MKKLLQYKIQILAFSLLLMVAPMVKVQAQIYHVGDVIVNPDSSRGVVFHVHPDGSGGWMVALRDVYNDVDYSYMWTWGTCGDIPDLTNYRIDHVQELLADMDGYANTQSIRNYQENDPNCYAVDSIDFENGWYLPSTGQLYTLFAAHPFIETALINAGGTLLSDYYWYWSSTEKNSEAAWRMKYGEFNSLGKNEMAAVRPVRNFTVNNTVYDTVMTYMWNTEETTPHINMVPDTTTIYSVIATTGYGCSNSAEQTLIVNAPVPITILDTICEGENYHAYGFNVDESQTINAEEVELEQTLQNAYGCDSIVTLKLFIEDTSLSIISSNDFCDEFHTNLMVNSSLTDYIWNTGETTSSIDVNSPGTYSVTVTSDKCEASTALDIEDCGFELYLPNTITPTHADGLNDYFCIPSRQQAQIDDFEIVIVNRWGQCVFHSKDKNFKWRGEFNGSIQPNAVYNYLIRCSTWSRQKRLFKGSIVVL